MPSRVRSIDFSTLTVAEFSFGVDYVLVAKGRRVAQVTAVTLPATAAGLFGLKVGAAGEPVRMNAQGQPINLIGDVDQLDGVWLVWMGTALTPPVGVVEFLLGTSA